MNRIRTVTGALVLISTSILGVANLGAGELPPREPLDTLWEQHMLEGKINTAVAIQLKDGKVLKSEIPAKESIEYSRGVPESAGLGIPGVSVMQLGEGFWGNGGWVLEGGLLGIAIDGGATFELHGKAIVHRYPYFPFPFHRTIPHDTGYDFFLLHREAGIPTATVVRKWTFTPQHVELKLQEVGPPEAEVHATLRYDATAKNATVTITGVTSPIEDKIDVSAYTSLFRPPVQ